MTRSLFLAALAWLSVVAHAADDGGGAPTTLPRHVVTAQGLFGGWTVDPSGSAGVTVPAASWESFSAVDLADALHRIPGVTVARFNPVGAFGGGDGGAIFIRGHGSSRPGGEISILIDGVPRFMGVFSHPLLDLVDVGLGHEITVFKSPQSVILGNHAFAGINIAPWAAPAGGPHGRAEAGFGDFGTRWGTLRLGGGAENVRVAGGLAYRESDGHRANSDGRTDHAWARSTLQVTKALSLSALYHHSESEASNPRAVGAAPIPIVERYTTEADFFLLRADLQTGPASHTAKLHGDFGRTTWQQWDGEPPPPVNAAFENRIRFRNRGASWQTDFRASEDWSFLTGASTDVVGGTTEDIYAAFAGAGGPPATQYLHETGVFAKALHETTAVDGSRFATSVGIRREFHHELDDTWAAELGARWMRRTWTWHAQLSRGFNYAGAYASVLNQRWAAFLPSSSWRTIAPETIQHGELGAIWQPNDRVETGVVVYADRVRNVLRLDPPPPPVSFTSLARYDTRGIEAHVHWKPANALRLTISGTRTATDPERVPNLPEWTSTVAAQWIPVRDWRIDADLIWTSAQWVQNVRSDGNPTRLSENRRATLFVSRRFALKNEASSLELFAGIDNVFNESAEYRPGYPMPARNLRGGARWEF